MLGFVKRLVVWSLLGAVLGPVLGFLFVLGFCDSPGHSGGCAIDLVAVPPMLIIPGILVTVAAGFVRSAFLALRGVDIVSGAIMLWRRARRWPYDD